MKLSECVAAVMGTAAALWRCFLSKYSAAAVTANTQWEKFCWFEDKISTNYPCATDKIKAITRMFP